MFLLSQQMYLKSKIINLKPIEEVIEKALICLWKVKRNKSTKRFKRDLYKCLFAVEFDPSSSNDSKVQQFQTTNHKRGLVLLIPMS